MEENKSDEVKKEEVKNQDSSIQLLEKESEVKEEKQEQREEKNEIAPNTEQIETKQEDTENKENEKKDEEVKEETTQLQVIENEEENKEEIKKKSKAKKAIAIVFVILLILVALFFTIFAILNLRNTKIIRGVQIGEINVSDMSKEDAKALLDERNAKNQEKQLVLKYGDLENVVKEIFSSDNIYGYRNKISLKVKGGKLGYFKNGSNELIEINRCAIASKKSNEIIKVLNECDLSKAREIIIKDFGEVMIIINGDMNIELLKPFSDSIYMNDKLVYGKENVIAHLGDLKFYVSKDSFFQVNMNIALKLYNKVLEYLDSGDNVLDLYCGTGTISLFLSKYFDRVIGIEINEEAVRCANLNKKLNHISNAEFICGDASKKIHHLKFQADSIVVDPPRSGLTSDGINDILKINPKKLVYVSCDPMTLARDLKLLKSNYEVKEVTLFDMFPWTYHVESVVLCIKK